MACTSVFEVGLPGLMHNVIFAILGLVTGLGLGFVPLGLWALRLVHFSLAGLVRAFLALWTAPALLFYAVSHVGQYGYFLVVLPPLAILAAVAAWVLGLHMAAWHSNLDLRVRGANMGMVACIAVALFSLAYFAVAQGPVTASSIEQNDTHWRALQIGLRKFDPVSTVLVTDITRDSPFREAGYLLPQCRLYGIDVNEDGALKWLYSANGGESDYSLPMPAGRDLVDLPASTTTVIALDALTAERPGTGGLLDCVRLADGSTMYVLREGHPLSSPSLECGKITPIERTSARPIRPISS